MKQLGVGDFVTRNGQRGVVEAIEGDLLRVSFGNSTKVFKRVDLEEIVPFSATSATTRNEVSLPPVLPQTQSVSPKPAQARTVTTSSPTAREETRLPNGRFGAKMGRPKLLTEEQEAEITIMHTAGEGSERALAERFGVKKGVVEQAVKRTLPIETAVLTVLKAANGEALHKEEIWRRCQELGAVSQAKDPLNTVGTILGGHLDLEPVGPSMWRWKGTEQDRKWLRVRNRQVEEQNPLSLFSAELDVAQKGVSKAETELAIAEAKLLGVRERMAEAGFALIRASGFDPAPIRSLIAPVITDILEYERMWYDDGRTEGEVDETMDTLVRNYRGFFRAIQMLEQLMGARLWDGDTDAQLAEFETRPMPSSEPE